MRNILFFLLLFTAGMSNAQYRYAGKVLHVSREYDPYPESWCAAHILGAPNVYPQYDDIAGAWVATNYGKQRDTIDVGFDNNSPIDSILIWETCGAGIADSVFIKNPNTNKWVLVFSRKGQNYPEEADTMARILRIGFPMTVYNVNEVRIMMANDSSKTWAELDAVAIHPQTLSSTVYSDVAGKAANFDGKDDYYRTTFAENELTFYDKFTIAAWINVADTAYKTNRAYRGNGIIFDGDYGYIGITTANLGGGDSIYAFVDDATYSPVGIPYTQNTWVHITMVNTPDSLRVYVNGHHYRTAPGSKFDSTDGYGIFEFGRNYNNSTYFKGSMDEVKMFNRALTAAEVLHQSYSIGAGAVNSNMVGYWQFNETDSSFWNKFMHRTDSMHNGGNFVTTGTILANKMVQKSGMRIYPNPNNGNFMVQLPAEMGNAVSIRVSDVSGKTVYSSHLNRSAGAVMINLPSINKGVYFVQISDGNHASVERIVIE